jgi:predicted O-methyltransferase YrrM
MKTVEDILKLKGQVSYGDVEALQRRAAAVPDGGLVVEIGCYCGASSAAIASRLKPNCKMVCIDPWMKQADYSYFDYNKPETLLAFRESTDEWKAQITQVVGYPLDVAQWWNAPIDLLAMDCMKEYSQIAPIWAAWFPFVKIGGIICSHDYQTDPTKDWHFPGVIQALNEIVTPHITDITHNHFTYSGVRVS